MFEIYYNSLYNKSIVEICLFKVLILFIRMNAILNTKDIYLYIAYKYCVYIM